MRIHSLIIIGLLALPAGSSAQGVRLPRPGQRTPVQPAEPPPEMPVVARALSMQRSRWTTEAYTLMSSVRIPATAAAGVTTYSTLGSGTRADYRISDRWSATMDMTASMFGGPINETAEVGTRFSPLLWEPDTRSLRPFFDVRAAYMHMYDSFLTPIPAIVGGAAPGEQFSTTGRYSRGFGAAAGAGMEFGITPTIAVTTEFSALRNNMLIYHLTTTSSLPAGDHYMMTSYRMAIGIKYNPLRTMDLKQNPR